MARIGYLLGAIFVITLVISTQQGLYQEFFFWSDIVLDRS